MGQAQLRHEAGQPRQQAEVQRHRGGHRPGRRLRRRDPGRAGLRGRLLLLPGQPAPRALHRRAGRHQRRQELPERRRQHLPPVLRHDQGRRLPRARGERLSPRAGVGEHHRPVRGAGRALRARVRRHARQPLLRRRAGLAHLLRPRPDRPAAPARRLLRRSSARSASARCKMYPAHRDARPGGGRRPRQGHRHPRPGHRRDRVLGRRTRSCSPPAATATSSSSPPTPRAATSPPPGAPTRKARSSPTPATRRSTPPASRSAASTSPSSRSCPSRSATTAASGCRSAGRQARARPDPRGGARLLPRTQVSQLRQPRAPRHLLARGQGSLRRGPRRRPRRAGRLPRLRRCHQAAGRERHPRALRQPLRHVREDHRRESPTRCRCASSRRCTTRWAASGWTTT